MKAISKKLLSLLVVIAMVLSMVPFGGLSIFAVETKAAETETTVTPGQANLPEGISITKVDNSDEAIEANIAARKCPMCGAEDIEWQEATSYISDSASAHWYYAADYSRTANVISMYSNDDTTLCVAVKSGVTLSYTGGADERFLMINKSGSTLNVMGTGTIQSTDAAAMGVFQIDNGTVNLYGGTYINKSTSYGTMRVKNSAVLNIYDGATIGSETLDATTPQFNLRISGGTVNMYGGIIRNGVTNAYNISGNVTIAKGTFNMYGGTIAGGQYLAGTNAEGNALESPASIGGNVLVGGKNEDGTATKGYFNMYGGFITGGKTNNGGNGGGNVCNLTTSVTNLQGGTISDGWAKAKGGNVQIQSGTLTISGTVLITNGYAKTCGGNVDNNGGTVTMSGGFITGGEVATEGGTGNTAGYGGAVSLNNGSFTMTGGTIDGCWATSHGGNIYVVSGKTITVKDTAIIKNGKTTGSGKYGGNIHLEGATLTMEGGTVSGGYATAAGGNISGAANSQISISGGSVYGGSFDPTGTGWGGNIRAYNATVNISGGYIYDGCVKNATSNQNAGNIGALGTSTLNISGGNIGGDIAYVNGKLTLSGAPKIKYSGLKLADGTSAPNAEYVGLPVYSTSAIDIGGLTGDAEIQVTGSSIGITFTASNANAADVVGCFSSTATNQEVALTDDNMQLKIIEKVVEPEVGVFDPESFDGQAYCPVCYANGDTELKTWTAFANPGTDGEVGITAVGGKHMYLAGDVTVSGNQVLYSYGKDDAPREGCFNLNGHTLTMDGRIGLTGRSTLNILDTSEEKSGVVTTDGSKAGGAATVTTDYGQTIVIQAAGTINLYGGTYKNTSGIYPVLYVKGTTESAVNIYEDAVIDGGSTSQCVYITAGTVNLKGGTIKGGYATKCGGNVYLTGSNSKLTIEKNSIVSGGVAAGTTDGSGGGNIYVGTNAQLVVDGTVSGGKAEGYSGGNIMAASGTKVTINSTGKIIGIKDTQTAMYGAGVATSGNAQLDIYGEIKDCVGNRGGSIDVMGAGIVNIYEGAKITGGKSTSSSYGGGNLFAQNASAVITMSGGEISGGTAAGYGGNLMVSKSTLNMTGGTISGGTAEKFGGNIYVRGNTSVTLNGTITGGTAPSGGSIAAVTHREGSGSFTYYSTTLSVGGNVSGGTATNGGNIYIINDYSDGAEIELTVTGGTIEGGNASTYGGNIYANSANVTVSITGGTIKNGTSVSGGGNIYAAKLAKLTVNGSVEVDNGTASTGGNIYATTISGTIELGGTWTGGTATGNHRANVSLLNSNVHISGATITGGTAAGQCGALGFYKCPTVTIENSTITGGTAGSNTGTLWIATNAGEVSALDSVVASEVTIKNSSVTATDDKPAIAVAGGCTLVIDGTTSVSGGMVAVKSNALKDDTTTEEKESATIVPAKLEVKSTWTGTADVSLPAMYYCGDTLSAVNITADGAFEGTLMNVYGDNAAVLYNTEDGSLYLAGYAVVDTTNENATVWYGSMDEAVAAAAAADPDNATKYLLAGADVALNGETVYIDALSAITVTGTGTAYGIDPANADFTTASTGSFSGNVQSDATFNGVRYLKIADGTVHAIEMRLTNVTLRANDKCGLYYKASFKCDSTLAAAIEAYGVALNLKEVPDENFWQSDTFTVNENFMDMYNSSEIANTVNTNSGGVWNIMKSDLDADKNRERLVRHIYANAYILLEGSDTPIMADTENAGTTNGVGYSLYEVMAAVNDKVDTLTNENQVKAVAKFYSTWSSVWSESFTVDGILYNPVEDFANIAAKAAELNV